MRLAGLIADGAFGEQSVAGELAALETLDELLIPDSALGLNRIERLWARSLKEAIRQNFRRYENDMDGRPVADRPLSRQREIIEQLPIGRGDEIRAVEVAQ